MSAPIALPTALAAVVAVMKTALADFAVKDIALHHGTFSELSLKQYAVAAPCVRLAVMGMPRLKPYTAHIGMALTFSAFVITTDKYLPAVAPANPVLMTRDDQIYGIVPALMRLVQTAQWGLPNFSSADPDSINARNLWSDGMPALGIALWGVGWSQLCSLDVSDPDTLDRFTTLSLQVQPPGADLLVTDQQSIPQPA